MEPSHEVPLQSDEAGASIAPAAAAVPKAANEASDGPSKPGRPEKDPERRIQRKQNKRQKYKERQQQAAKSAPPSSDRSKPTESTSAGSKPTADNDSLNADELSEEEASQEAEQAVAAPRGMAGLLEQLQSEHEAKKKRAFELFEQADFDKMDKEDLQIVRSAPGKKRVYSAWIGETGDQDARAPVDPVGLQMKLDARTEKETRQHRGLRCKKCWCLLARDDDFEYRNGLLWLKFDPVSQGWEGLSIRGDKVFCQNMHLVGEKVVQTLATARRSVPVLKVHKTTFKENFIDNPEFAGSDLIVNKTLAGM